MAKEIACVVEGCGWQEKAPTEGELMQKVAAHAEHGHGLAEISPDLAAKVKAAIRER